MVASITIILAQLIIYGLLVWVLAKRIGSYRPLSKIAFLLACLVVGLIAGLLTVFLWSRIDTVVYPNMAASLLGDQVYIWATSKVAPGVAAPHCAIAWPLRIPQVYAFISIILFGVVGLVLQTAYNRNQN